MYSFGSFLQDLSLNSGIKFNLTASDGNSIYLGGLNVEDSESVYFPINLESIRASLSLPKKFEICAPLLKYTIENKYSELFTRREQSIISILDGKEVSKDSIDRNLPALSKGVTLFVINVEGSRYEALNIIKQLYNDQDALCFIYGDSIVVLGDFDEIQDHAKSIRDSITSELYCRCKISYSCEAVDIKGIKKAYDDAKECLILARNFGIKDEIFYYNKMLFEKIVYNIKPVIKQELLESFKSKFNLFDSEIITTIEEFVNCGLNISDAARKLYVHRNTLIYRLDKIQKETGFDIRNFKEATIFIIAFLVWKENVR